MNYLMGLWTENGKIIRSVAHVALNAESFFFCRSNIFVYFLSLYVQIKKHPFVSPPYLCQLPVRNLWLREVDPLREGHRQGVDEVAAQHGHHALEPGKKKPSDCLIKILETSFEFKSPSDEERGVEPLVPAEEGLVDEDHGDGDEPVQGDDPEDAGVPVEKKQSLKEVMISFMCT